MEDKRITRRNLIMFPLGTVGRDMMYNLVTSYLYTFVLFTRQLTAAQLSAIAERTEKDMTIRIVTTIRAKPFKGLISIDSPLGKALLHHKVGERLLVTLDNGESYYVVIRSIEKTEDDSDDAISQY